MWELLNLMAYGTYQEYKANETSFPGMNEGRLHKLKQLSLVSLSESTRVLEYAAVLTALDLASTEALESLVVSCIYADILVASLDQKAQQVEIQVSTLLHPLPAYPCTPPAPHSARHGP